MQTTKLTDTTINLDASLDLYTAGYDNRDECQEDFEDAYIGAANDIGALLGVRIEVETHPEPGQPAEETGSWAEQVDLWQLIHDCLQSIDGQWVWHERKCEQVAEKIKRTLN